MLDKKINNYLNPYLFYLAKILFKFNISANFITLIGFIFGLSCFYSIINTNFTLAFLFLFLNRFFDGLYGAVARSLGETDLGAFYDIISYFIFYSMCFLLLSFVSTQSTFLASAWLFEKNKILISKKNTKSFFYIGGFTEGFETIICFSLMLLFNNFVELISYCFGTLCWITFVFRICYIRKILAS